MFFKPVYTQKLFLLFSHPILFGENVPCINWLYLLFMLLGIWLALCQQVSGLNSLGLGALVYTNGFIRDAIHKCGESSLGFPVCGFPWKGKKIA